MIFDVDFICKLMVLVIVFLYDLVIVNHVDQVDTFNSTQNIHETIVNWHVNEVSFWIFFRWGAYQTWWYCSINYFVNAFALYKIQIILMLINRNNIISISYRVHFPFVSFDKIDIENLSIFKQIQWSSIHIKFILIKLPNILCWVLLIIV